MFRLIKGLSKQREDTCVWHTFLRQEELFDRYPVLDGVGKLPSYRRLGVVARAPKAS